MNVLTNELEIKLVYTFNNNPITSLDHTKNLGFKLGESTWNENNFDIELANLVKAGILVEAYDFTDGGFREGLYNFTNEAAQISFFGNNHMDMKLSYNY